MSLKVGQREFIGEGVTRQTARHNAAEKALSVLQKLPLPCDETKRQMGEAPAPPAAAPVETGYEYSDGETIDSLYMIPI